MDKLLEQAVGLAIARLADATEKIATILEESSYVFSEHTNEDEEIIKFRTFRIERG